MKFTIFDEPVKVYGIYNFDNDKKIERLNSDLRKKLELEHLGLRTPGARLAFRTNSKSIKFTIKFKTMSLDKGMSIYAAQSANVYYGRGDKARFAGFIGPNNYTQKECNAVHYKNDALEDIVVYLPRNEEIENIIFEIEDGAQLFPPTPYKYEKPICFFGSSITEGAYGSRVVNCYTALLSKWLDVDYYNYGFSGGCKGQLEFVELFSKFDLSAFVYDYDHNAPNAEFLQNTHKPFFDALRKVKPDLPIIMLTAPNYDYLVDAEKRRQIIKQTYETAVANGDKNVYFVDGKDFFDINDRQECTVDALHPNDVGHYRMAEKIYPVLKKVLERNIKND